MDTYTSITYSKKQNSKDCYGTVEKLEYTSSIKDNDKHMHTSYVNSISSLRNEQHESFNKLLKNRNDVYEQVGSSHNRSDWSVKEYHNTSLNKEYNDPYVKHNFDEAVLECLPVTAIQSSEHPFVQLKNRLLK